MSYKDLLRVINNASVQYNQMITFYQWNKTFRTLGDSKLSNLSPQVQKLAQKNDELLINGYKKQSRKSCKQKTLRQHVKHQEKQLKLEIKDEIKQIQVSPFKNVAIRQRLKTFSPEKAGQSMRISLKISKININKSQLPMRKQINQTIKYNLVYSGRKKPKMLNHNSVNQINSHRSSIKKQQSYNLQKIEDSTFLINRKSLISHSNCENRFKVLSSILDKYKPSNKKIANQALLRKFINYQKRNQQINVVDQIKQSRKYSKTSNAQQQTGVLLPSRRKSYRNDQSQNRWNRYRRSTSNYKTKYDQNTIKEKNHKKSMHSMPISWQTLALNQ